MLTAAAGSSFVPDFARVNKAWPDGPPLETIEDLFSVTVDVGGAPMKVATHLFGDTVTFIPYALPRSEDAGMPADPTAVPYGTAEIARHFPPGDIGFAIKHRRIGNRTLQGPPFAGLDKLTREFTRHIKLQDVHIAAVLGIEDRDRAGDRYPSVVIISNPAWYRKSMFYQRNYPMVFVRPRFPNFVTDEQRAAFRDNIRTMLVCFNIVSRAPRNYDADPLAACSQAAVRTHVEMMLRAMTGDATGAAFFRKRANWVYCGELIHLSASAGLLYPLNRSTWGSVLGDTAWSAFERVVSRHNLGAPDAVARTKGNAEDLLKIRLMLSPEELKPVADYAPIAQRPNLSTELAFRPMTLVDIVEQFVRAHWPRAQIGDRLAPSQAQVLRQLAPAFITATGLTRVPPAMIRSGVVEGLVAEIIATVGAPHTSYAAFLQRVEPLRREAKAVMQAAGVQDLFTPPSMFHLMAQGKYPDGLLGIEYVGHGLHRSMVARRNRFVLGDR